MGSVLTESLNSLKMDYHQSNSTKALGTQQKLFLGPTKSFMKLRMQTKTSL